jgi:predicted glutamine amidotransferase
MCMLSLIPTNVEPDYEGLLNGGVLNPDGSGWAIAVDGKIVWGKSMDACQAIDQFSVARDRYPNGPALFHSRWATHGSKSLANVHPFFVGNSYQTVMAHNGILQCTPTKGDDRSDSRLFADDILSTRFKRLDKRRAFTALHQFCGTYNKLGILTVDSRYQENLYIVNEKEGHWDRITKNWHSNYDYLGWTKYSGSYSSTATQGWTPTTIGKRRSEIQKALADSTLCYICEFGHYTTSGYCDECGTCEECLENRLDCQCYLGASWNTDRDDISAAAISARIAADTDMS